MKHNDVTSRDVPKKKPGFDAWQSMWDLQWAKWTDRPFSSPMAVRPLSYHASTAPYLRILMYNRARVI